MNSVIAFDGLGGVLSGPCTSEISVRDFSDPQSVKLADILFRDIALASIGAARNLHLALADAEALHEPSKLSP